jgi:hypothetical protein
VARLRAEIVTTWVVRFVDASGIFRIRTFQTEEAAVLFIRQVRADPASPRASARRAS